MVNLNRCFFIDISACIITKSGSIYPQSIRDWNFDDRVITSIKDNQYKKVCLIADKGLTVIVNIRQYEQLIDFIKEQLFKILELPVEVVFHHSKDGYLNYPFPGGILSFVIENDIDLMTSVYITDNRKSFNLSGIRNGYSKSQFILYG